MSRVLVPLSPDVLDRMVADPTVVFLVFLEHARRYEIIGIEGLRPWVAGRSVAGVVLDTQHRGELTIVVFGPRRPNRDVLARLRVVVDDDGSEAIAEALTPAASAGEATA